MSSSSSPPSSSLPATGASPSVAEVKRALACVLSAVSMSPEVVACVIRDLESCVAVPSVPSSPPPLTPPSFLFGVSHITRELRNWDQASRFGLMAGDGCHIAAMNSDVEPLQKKKKTNPSPSFLSLPDDIIMNCLAHMSRSYYPKLSLVCKTFRSLVSSNELSNARSRLGTREHLFHICLKLPSRSRPSWFTLLIKPDQTLTNDLEKKEDNTKCSGNALLVEIPSSYSPSVPSLVVRAGSECYKFIQNEAPSQVMRVRKKRVGLWREAHMTLARESPVASVVDKKIYVMGGCGEQESANWAECFDPKTQTWEPLPDPGVQLRGSEIKNLEVINGKLDVRSNTVKNYVYDPKQGTWSREAKRFQKHVKIDNVFYTYAYGCKWYDTERREWRKIRGMENWSLFGGIMDIANYCGKLLILWNKWEDDELAHNGHYDQLNHNLWCAVIALERRNNDEVWGNIEWANVVFTSTRSFDFVRSRVSKI